MTGIGGGTIRDLVLGVPVFWAETPAYVLVCASVALVVLFAAPLLESRYRLLLWLDAIGLAAFAVFGAYKGLDVTGSRVIAVVTGPMTATAGGILRDILAREPSVLMRPEVYVAAALAGGLVFVGLDGWGLTLPASAIAGFAVSLALRGGAIASGWSLPRYRPRPGRGPNDAR